VKRKKFRGKKKGNKPAFTVIQVRLFACHVNRDVALFRSGLVWLDSVVSGIVWSGLV
jgi:hypothetical protein